MIRFIRISEECSALSQIIEDFLANGKVGRIEDGTHPGEGYAACHLETTRNDEPF
jgi:hypothetical protein